MPSFVYKDILTEAGLNANEAIVYEYLLKNGESPAGEIIKKTPLKRGVVYNALKSLMKKDLIEQKTRNKVAYFSPEHPEKLREFVEAQEDRLQKAERNLVANLPKLISDFHIVSNRPGIKYFEGLEGLKKTLNDILTATETVYTFADIEKVAKYMENLNKQHVAAREKINLHKKVITTDSPFAKNYLKGYYPKITKFKFIDYKLYPLHSLVEIYDGKVAYISLSDTNIMSMIVIDQNIYKFHRSIFEFIWARAKKLKEL